MNRMMLAVMVAAVAALGICPVSASDPIEVAADPMAVSQLDGFVLGLAHAEKFSGVVLVSKNGRILLERAYGKQDEQQDHANTIDTRFNLASAGKMFTAVAILQQVAADRISLDTRVGEVLKDYPNKDFADKVTVRQLLTHTAGAGDVDLFGTENANNRQRIHSVSEMVALHADRAPAFEPGSNQEYGNFGHVVLGRMIEVLSGQTFEVYLQAHVFGPVGMNRTGFVNCTDRAADIAVGYVDVDGAKQLNCATLPSRGFPAGGQVATARDMFKFVEALKAGKLIPAPLFEEAIRPYREFMGLGFFATEYGPGYLERNFRWGHAGSADGICTDVRTHPLTGETIIVLSNVDIPGCFDVSSFLHRQWALRQQERSGSATPQAIKDQRSEP